MHIRIVGLLSIVQILVCRLRRPTFSVAAVFYKPPTNFDFTSGTVTCRLIMTFFARYIGLAGYQTVICESFVEICMQ